MNEKKELFNRFFISKACGAWSSSTENNGTERYNFGEILLFFANLNIDTGEKDKIRTCVQKYIENKNIEQYFEGTLKLLNESYGGNIANTIMMDTYNLYYNEGFYTDVEPIDKYYVIAPETIALERILGVLNACADMAKLYVDKIVMVNENDLNQALGKKGYTACMLSSLSDTIQDEISYNIHCCLDDKEDIEFFDIYTIKKSRALLVFELSQILKNNIKINKCENCGKYFIPISRSDEKYCYYKDTNNKSCRDNGYENKINSDEILKLYRTIYKTQNARKQRNKCNNPHIDENFKKWSVYAKEQLKLCQNKKINLDTFKNNISKTDWMCDNGNSTKKG